VIDLKATPPAVIATLEAGLGPAGISINRPSRKRFILQKSRRYPDGLLLRRDIHALFDSGYITVSPDLRFNVSRRIKEEFENGRDYYQLHGQPISLPTSINWKPAGALAWHNETRFLR
jgi:hypothetical protein